MSTKPDSLRSILINLLFAIAFLLVPTFTGFQYDEALHFVGALLLTSVFSTLLQKHLTSDTAFRFRSLFPVATMVFGFLILGLSYRIAATRFMPAKKILYLVAFGATWGIIWGLSEFIINRRREKSIPYTGPEIPILSDKASIGNFKDLHGQGRALLLSDRILFLGKKSQVHEIFLNQIRDIQAHSNSIKPIKLAIHLMDAGYVSLYVSMPYIWMRKIKAQGVRLKAEVS